MRNKIVWTIAVLALIATPAIVGVVVLGGGSGERILGAGAGVGSGQDYGPLSVARLELILDGANYGTWRKLTWGIDQEVASGPGDEKLAPGRATYRPMLLEEVLTSSSKTSQFIASIRKGQRYAEANVRLFNAGGNPVGTYTLNEVLIGSIEHEITVGGSPPPVGLLSLRYADVTYTP